MKHLITCLALGIACAAGAQTGLVEFPYNPDADEDDVIGTVDLLSLLSVYGSEFSIDDLFLNSDSTGAVFFVGELSSPKCMNACKALPGFWRVMNLFDAGMIWDELMEEAFSYSNYWQFRVWIQTNENTEFLDSRLVRQDNTYDNGVYIEKAPRADGSGFSPNNIHDCYCATQERPKVEYSYCEGTEIQSCADAKVADGWYPLGGPSTMSYNGWHKTQAFWRWAE